MFSRMDKIRAVYRSPREDERIPRGLDIFWDEIDDFQGVYFQPLDVGFQILLACLLRESRVEATIVVDVVGKPFQVVLTIVLDAF
jgi:hypothetical protein